MSTNTETSKVQAVPEGMHTVTPHLVIGGAAEAIDFYVKAFGAKEIGRVPAPDGRIMHAAIQIGDSQIYLHDEYPEYGSLGPKARGGSSVTIHLQVENADALFEQAVAAGCTVKMPLADMFWGDRYGVLRDPFGHLWSMGQPVREVSDEELSQAIHG